MTIFKTGTGKQYHSCNDVSTSNGLSFPEQKYFSPSSFSFF
jgi:hypothetical protein